MIGTHGEIRVEPDVNARLFRLLHLYSAGSAIAVIATGCLVLLGWAFHIEFLKSIVPGFVSMKANTALCATLSGTSLWLLLGKQSAPKTLAAHGLALLVAVISAANLGEYMFGLDLGLDQLLFNDAPASYGTSSPGRMSLPTATAFLAIGAALAILDRKTRTGRLHAQILSLTSGLIALLAISGYIYDATVLTRIQLYTQIAVHTSTVLLLLSSAIFFARPKSEIVERHGGSIFVESELGHGSNFQFALPENKLAS